MECSPTDSTGALEIGEKHVFASRSNRRFLRRRRSCSLFIRVVRKSKLTPEVAEKINLSESKIGVLRYEPSMKGEGRFSRAIPAYLEAIIYLSDELHGRLLDAILARRRPIRLDLEIEKVDALGYGWEPDGSRKVWKIESTTEPSEVNASSINLRMGLLVGWRYLLAYIVDIVPGPLLWAAIVLGIGLFAHIAMEMDRAFADFAIAR
jgi:hypothetical protein